MSIRLPTIAMRALIFAAFALAGTSAFAQTATPWSSLTPDEQQVLEAVHKHWDELPPPAQQRLLRGADRWSTLTPAQRDKVRKRFENWSGLPPGQRAKQ